MFGDYEFYHFKLYRYLPCNSSVPFLGMYPRALALKHFGFFYPPKKYWRSHTKELLFMWVTSIIFTILEMETFKNIN